MNKDFSNLSDRLEYYSDNQDYYFYKKIHSIIDNNIKFFDKNHINFTLIMSILLNKLFGNYNFYDRILYLSKFNIPPNNNLIVKINNIYNQNIKIFDNYIYFNKSLLSVDILKELYSIRDYFYNLSFIDRFDLIENFEIEIKNILFLSSYIEYNSIDKNYFLFDNQINSNFSDIENSLMNNNFFKNYINVKTINELYLSFSITDNESNNSESNFLLNEKKFIYYKNFIKTIYFKEIDNSVYIYSNIFNSSLNKKSKIMINVIKKTNNNFSIFNIRKMLTNLNNNQIKLININNISDEIILEFDPLVNMYFINDIINVNIFNMNIKLGYSIDKQIFTIVIDNKITDKLYYKLDNDEIYRIYDKYTLSLGKIKLNEFNFTNIIFPYEYIIIILFLTFSKIKIKTKKTITNKAKNKIKNVTKKITGSNNSNNSNEYEKLLLKELGKNNISKKDSQVKDFLKKSTDKLFSKNSGKKSLNEYIKELNKNDIKSKKQIINLNNCGKNLIEFMSNSNSILLNINYYKLKYYEQQYYFNSIKENYNSIKQNIKDLEKQMNEDVNTIKNLKINNNADNLSILFKDNINKLQLNEKLFKKKYNDVMILYFYNNKWLEYFINEFKYFKEFDQQYGGQKSNSKSQKQIEEEKKRIQQQKIQERQKYAKIAQNPPKLSNNENVPSSNNPNNSHNSGLISIEKKFLNIIFILNKNLCIYFINLLSDNFNDLDSNNIISLLLNYIEEEFMNAIRNVNLYNKFQNNSIGIKKKLKYNTIKLFYIMNTFKIQYLKNYLNIDKYQNLYDHIISEIKDEDFQKIPIDLTEIENKDILVKEYNIINIIPEVTNFVNTHSKLFRKFDKEYYYFNLLDFKKIINCLKIYKQQLNTISNNISIIINKNNFLKNKIKFNLKSQFIDLNFDDFIDKDIKNYN